jgi:uncharacterized protein
MNSTFFITTGKANVYLINIQKKNILLVHPVIPFIYFNEKKADIEIDRDEFVYYQRKIAYYKKYGIISDNPLPENEQLYLTPELIEESISNLKQIVFETTEKCNLNCKYCYYGDYYQGITERKNLDIPVEYADILLEYLSKKQLLSLNKSWKRLVYISFYGGEPLMNMTFIENVIKAEKFKNRNIVYSMTTNATLLDKYMNFMIANDIHLIVSLDGKEENNAYRIFHNGRQSFHKILSNLKLMQQHYPEYFKKNVNFNAVLHNKNSVEEIYNFFKTEFNKDVYICELNNSNVSTENREDFCSAYRNKTESLMQSENYEKIESELFLNIPSVHSVLIFLHQYLSFVYKSYEDLIKANDKALLISTGTCIPFSKKMFVTADGKLLPCEKISHKYALGKVNKTGIQLDTAEIAEKYNRYFKKISKQCSICYRQISCNQCLFHLEDLEDNLICHGFMNENNMREYLSNNLSFLEAHPSDYLRIMKDVIVS